jgi:hypothetical protein
MFSIFWIRRGCEHLSRPLIGNPDATRDQCKGYNRIAIKNAMQKQRKGLEWPKYEKSRSARRLQHCCLGNHRPIETLQSNGMFRWVYDLMNNKKRWWLNRVNIGDDGSRRRRRLETTIYKNLRVRKDDTSLSSLYKVWAEDPPRSPHSINDDWLDAALLYRTLMHLQQLEPFT